MTLAEILEVDAQIDAAASAADLERVLAHCVDRATRAPDEPFVWFAVGRARMALRLFQEERGLSGPSSDVRAPQRPAHVRGRS